MIAGPGASGRRYQKHCMVSNQTVVAIFRTMTPRDFQQLQRDLEEAMLKLKKANDPNARRELLAEMRRLLAEADRFNLEAE
jgi:flagellar motor switch protein FliG